MRVTFLTIITLLASLIFLSSPVMADSTSIQLSPSVIHAVIKPQNELEIKFTLVNLSDPTLIKLKVLPFQTSDNIGNIKLDEKFNGKIQFSVGESNFDLNEPFLLKSNARQPITLKVQVPKDIIEKDYYFTLIVESVSFPAAEGETTLQFSNKIGAHILLSVSSSGRIERKASIPLFAVPGDKPILKNIQDSSSAFPVVLMVKNNGRNAISPSISVTLKGWNLKKTYLLESSNILAASQRLIVDKSCHDCGKGESFLINEFLLGTYTLTATVNAGNDSQVIYSSTTFNAVPYKHIGIGAFIILLCFLLKKRR